MIQAHKSEPVRVLPPYHQIYATQLTIEFQHCLQCCTLIPFLNPLKQRAQIWMKQILIILENTFTNNALKGASGVTHWYLKVPKTKNFINKWILQNLLVIHATKTRKESHHIEYISTRIPTQLMKSLNHYQGSLRMLVLKFIYVTNSRVCPIRSYPRTFRKHLLHVGLM